MRAVINFFENVFDYKYFILSIGCLFLLVFVLCAILMATVSNLAKMRRGHKRALKFFKWNSVLFETNKNDFYKKVIRTLPIKVRRQWRTANKFYGDYCSVGFKNLLAESLRTGGNATFVGYVAVFIAGLTAIIISAMLMGGNTNEFAPMMSFTVAGGAGGLLLLATELYYLDKYADKFGSDFISTVSSRVLKKSETKCEEAALTNNIFNSYKTTMLDKTTSDSISFIDKNCIIQNENEKHSAFDDIFNEYYIDTAEDANAEEYEENEAIYESVSDDNVFENTDIIDRCPSVDENKILHCPRKECDLPSTGVNAVEPINYCADDSVKSAYLRVNAIVSQESDNKNVECVDYRRAEDFESLNKLMEFEERMNTMQNYNKCNDDKHVSDSISKLENLINGIVAEGVSDPLLRDVYGALNELDSYNYNNPIDKIRVKCLIRRLENAI